MNPILGVDFGRARIGLAISDDLRLLAHPLETVPAKKETLQRIAEIVGERNIEAVVVGIPKHMSEEVGQSAREALEFAAKLRALLPCPVETWDERLTTVAANRVLSATGK